MTSPIILAFSVAVLFTIGQCSPGVHRVTGTYVTHVHRITGAGGDGGLDLNGADIDHLDIDFSNIIRKEGDLAKNVNTLSFGKDVSTKQIVKGIQTAVQESFDGLQKAVKDFVVYVRTGVKDAQQQVQDGLDGKQSTVAALVNSLAAYYRQFGRGISAYTDDIGNALKLIALEAQKLQV